MMEANTTGFTLQDLAALNHATFMHMMDGVFEHSPWVAEVAWERRPFDGERDLHDAMMAAVRGAPIARQIAFLNAHPELAGKEALDGTMTSHSTFEQQGAGLAALRSDELRELHSLNAQYAQRHGFPFILNVLGHSKSEIFVALRERVGRDTESERETALEQIAQITQRRLHALFAAA